jgi:DNA-binding transcriptional regulator of glucitol operon
MRIKKFFSFIVTLIVIAFLIWLVISWIDINQHNNPFSNDYLNYAKWNLFEIFHKVKELIRF